MSLHAEGVGRVRVAGKLTFATVDAALLRSSQELVAAPATKIIDLADVTDGDSAGLALLLEWQCGARRSGRMLRFENLPASLRGIAAISEVGELLNEAVV